MEFLEQVTNQLCKNGPRLPGSKAHQVARDFIVNELKMLGVQPGLVDDWVQAYPVRESIGTSNTGYNIVGVVPGQSDSYIAVIAHYDTVQTTPGP